MWRRTRLGSAISHAAARRADVLAVGAPLLLLAFALALAPAMPGCGNDPGTALERLTESRRLAGELQVHFAAAADAGNLAVMADSDEASAGFAREVASALQATQADADALAPLLAGLAYPDESALLAEFGARFAEYRTLDASILGLDVENSNLKAQQLSFGAVREAADAFRDALAPLLAAAPATERWHAAALAATAVAAVRQVQALEAPHIAEADDAAMTRLEATMAEAQAVAHDQLEALAGLLPATSQAAGATATAALDKFTALHAELVALSRRNTNVRSLALSLGRKRTLSAACEDSLRALRERLEKRGFSGTR